MGKEQARRGRRARWLAAGAVVLVAGAGALLYLRPWEGGTAAVPVAEEPRLLTLRPTDHRVTVSGPGTLQAVTSLGVTVGTGLSGTLAWIVEPGTRVAAGEPLARLDPATFERAVQLATFALERAQAQLESLRADQAVSEANDRQEAAAAAAAVAAAERELEEAERELALVERLYALGSESEEALLAARRRRDDAAEALADALEDQARRAETRALQALSRAQSLKNAELSVEQARLDLEQAQADLRSLTVTAPFAGVVSAVNAVVGANVNDQHTLLTLLDDSRLVLVVQIDETEIADVATGQRAYVTLDAVPGRTFEGVVSAVSPVGRLESNIPIFDVSILLDNADLALRPGMTAESEIVVREVRGAFRVPMQAVTMGPEGAAVTVRSDSGADERRRVEVVATVGFESVVTGDLREGESLVVPPGFAVPRPGGPNAGAGPGFGLPGVGIAVPMGGAPGGRPAGAPR